MQPSQDTPSADHPVQAPGAYYQPNSSSSYPYYHSQVAPHAFYQPQQYWPPSTVSYAAYSSSSSMVAPSSSGQASSSTTSLQSRNTLGPVTSAVVNIPGRQPVQAASAVGQKRARTNNTAPARAAKRVRAQTTSDEPSSSSSPAIPGVGPIDSTPAPAIASNSGSSVSYHGASLLFDVKAAANDRHASDVWYLVRPLDSDDPPAGFTNSVGWTSNEAKERFVEQAPSCERYKSSHVGCRLCLQDWRTWKNSHGVTSAVRTHLKKYHEATYCAVVRAEKLKGWERLDSARRTDSESVSASPPKPFSLDEFNRKLVRWIVVDDQSINVVDCAEFRELIVYASEHIDDLDIPHRTKLTELIKRQCVVDFGCVIEEMKSSLGRISFTSDLWSNLKLLGFMAITGHYSMKDANGSLVIRSRLVAFRSVPVSHTGVNLAAVFHGVLKEYGLLKRIGQITLDNASNNNTMMREIARLLHLDNIPFDENGNRVRCFPHVINVAVKAGLALLTKVQAQARAPEDDSDYDSDSDDARNSTPSASAIYDAASNPALVANPDYYKALLGDPVVRCRALVKACRASGERRVDLRTAIQLWLQAKKSPEKAKELLRDVDTRWSALFLMLDRLIEFYGGVEGFLNATKQNAIRKHALEATELAVLDDIRSFLFVFHTAQEVLSYEKTPTLSIAIPTYETLLTALSELRDNKLPQLAHAINASIQRLKKYTTKARQTKIYSIAMVLNPLFKFTWIEKHWTVDEAIDARRWTREMMLEFHRANRLVDSTTSRTSLHLPQASSAARSQASGIARMNARLMKSLSNESILSGSMTSSVLATSSMSAASSSSSDAAEEAIADERVIDAELARYIRDGLLSSREQDDFDICRWWQSKQYDYPLLYRAALDVLPVQASAVPCERVFSSSKETDTHRRTNMSPELMERLQVLKYLYSHERGENLDFSRGWLATEADLLQPALPANLVEVLLSEGRVDELNALVDRSEL